MNQGTPLATDQYSRYQTEMFNDRDIISVPTALQAFFTNGRTFYSPNGNLVEINILRGNEEIAALIHRGGNGRVISGNKNLNVDKWTNIGRLYPLGEDLVDVSANQLNFTTPAENPYEMRAKLDRLRYYASEGHLESIRKFGRLFEFLCSEALLKGTMPAILGTTNTDLIYDFYRLATHIVAVSAKWDAVSADILGDIDSACTLIREDGHVTADMIIIGAGGMDALIKDTTVSAIADNRRFELIQVSTNNPVPPKFAKFVEGGLIARGRLRTPGGYDLWMFGYNDVYTNASGTATRYIPTDKALICYSDARCNRYFGPSEVLPMTSMKAAWYQETFGFNMLAPPMPVIKGGTSIIDPTMFYNDAYKSGDDKSITVRTQTAPIFATNQTDAFVTLTGLV